VKKVTINDMPKEPTPNNWSPMLINGDQMHLQRILKPGESNSFMSGILHFDAGSRTKFHKHSGDQILVIVEGTGKVATENEVLTVTEGDIVVIPAGESHWHGAPDDTSMAHIHVLVAGDETEQTEP
jgi:quercetin dioxygenase-like cupin family protein